MSRPTYTARHEIREYATEDELLAFANAMREAGGADPLEALLPSTQNKTHSCLIATSLNFSCQVDAHEDVKDTGSWQWYMEFPEGTSRDVAKAVAEAVGCELVDNSYGDEEANYYINLPEHIGNAAEAFDKGEGWTLKYATGSVETTA